MALAIVLPLSVFALFQARAAAAPPGVGFYLALFLGGFLLPLALVKIKACLLYTSPQPGCPTG